MDIRRSSQGDSHKGHSSPPRGVLQLPHTPSKLFWQMPHTSSGSLTSHTKVYEMRSRVSHRLADDRWSLLTHPRWQLQTSLVYRLSFWYSLQYHETCVSVSPVLVSPEYHLALCDVLISLPQLETGTETDPQHVAAEPQRPSLGGRSTVPWGDSRRSPGFSLGRCASPRHANCGNPPHRRVRRLADVDFMHGGLCVKHSTLNFFGKRTSGERLD